MALDPSTIIPDATHDRHGPAPAAVIDADDSSESTNVAAFFLGGVLIAGGLLAFLYYDDNTGMNRDFLATGSLSGIQLPLAPDLSTAKPAPSGS